MANTQPKRKQAATQTKNAVSHLRHERRIMMLFPPSAAQTRGLQRR